MIRSLVLFSTLSLTIIACANSPPAQSGVFFDSVAVSIDSDGDMSNHDYYSDYATKTVVALEQVLLDKLVPRRERETKEFLLKVNAIKRYRVQSDALTEEQMKEMVSQQIRLLEELKKSYETGVASKPELAEFKRILPNLASVNSELERSRKEKPEDLIFGWGAMRAAAAITAAKKVDEKQVHVSRVEIDRHKQERGKFHRPLLDEESLHLAVEIGKAFNVVDRQLLNYVESGAIKVLDTKLKDALVRELHSRCDGTAAQSRAISPSGAD